MTRVEVLAAVSQFPRNWEMEYLELTGEQDWWESSTFGDWHDLTLVRCYVPSTNRYFNLAKKAGGHYVVFGYGSTPSTRLGLKPPYDRIYFWRCFKCPSLNGMVAGCRHCAAVLKERKKEKETVFVRTIMH